MILRILALDVALANTGYAGFQLDVSNGNFKISEANVIETETGDTDTRVRYVLDKVIYLLDAHSINCVILEEPPQTLYNQKAPINVVVGRAVSTMKIVAACYGVIGLCHARDLFCRTVSPSTWQRLGKDEKKFAKATSFRKAKNILHSINCCRFPLNRDKDEHVADAINIGAYALMQFHSKAWELPNIELPRQSISFISGAK